MAEIREKALLWKALLLLSKSYPDHKFETTEYELKLYKDMYNYIILDFDDDGKLINSSWNQRT